MEALLRSHHNRMQTVSLDFIRPIMHEINWDDRLIMIRGQRGVGKTTLMLQHIMMSHNSGNQSDVLYVSLDNIYFSSHGLLAFVEQFHKMGGKYLFLDEVHKYETWSREIKNAYDEFPDMHFVLSGSSLVNLMDGDVDLSRRCIFYTMQGLSFREYLAMFHNFHFNIANLDDVLFHSNDICAEVNSKLRPLTLFPTYLQQGYFPFLKEGEPSYYTRIENIVNMTIERELPQSRHLDIGNIRKMKSLLAALSSNVPFEVDATKLSKMAEIARTTLLQYLQFLNDARLINLLYSDITSIKRMQKPDKIYLENTNLMHTLSTVVDIGAEREAFFVNQLSYKYQVEYSKSSADFTIDGKYTIEVGGRSKGAKQLKDVPLGFIAADNEEFTLGNKIPLWLFGFLY
ncbi:MAG: AAA family ATPase [Muribaculaceae bacterium]|nr:AAA family ATPase [Muribaculaceae bacterium]MBR6432272.1 AAA family ATPase [Muribaculaceae bacterium]